MQIEDQLYPIRPDTDGPIARNGPRGEDPAAEGGLSDASQIEVRRVDTSHSQVTVAARWEA